MHTENAVMHDVLLWLVEFSFFRKPLMVELYKENVKDAMVTRS